MCFSISVYFSFSCVFQVLGITLVIINVNNIKLTLIMGKARFNIFKTEKIAVALPKIFLYTKLLQVNEQQYC